MTERVRLSGKLICASPEECEIVQRHLAEHTMLSRAEPGCLSFAVRPSDDPKVWLVDEEFTDWAAFDAHQARVKASEWGRATVAIKRDFTISPCRS